MPNKHTTKELPREEIAVIALCIRCGAQLTVTGPLCEECLIPPRHERYRAEFEVVGRECHDPKPEYFGDHVNVVIRVDHGPHGGRRLYRVLIEELPPDEKRMKELSFPK